jgi:hypothetical protein
MNPWAGRNNTLGRTGQVHLLLPASAGAALGLVIAYVLKEIYGEEIVHRFNQDHYLLINLVMLHGV